MNREHRLNRLDDYYTPRLTQGLANRTIAALEDDVETQEVDGIPIGLIIQWASTALIRLERIDTST
jgi:hypothetical protein